MTSPKLSLDTDCNLAKESRKIGRVYQRPGDTLVGPLTKQEALEGLKTRRLMPSITNVVGVADKKLDGYIKWAIEEALYAGWDYEDAMEAPDIYRDLTAERGNLIHKLAEDAYDVGLLVPENWDSIDRDFEFAKLNTYQEIVENDKSPLWLKRPYNGMNYVKAFKNFITEVRPVFTHSEATVYGETIDGLLYAGTTDFIADINGVSYVGDYKTSNKLQPSTALQIAAVKNAKEITTDFETLKPMVKVDKGLGVNLCGNGEYILYETNIEEGWEAFQGLRRNWKIKATNGSGLLKRVRL
jgi:hypothetical protein